MQEGLLVTDVDNTVFDWMGIWSRATEAMLAVLETETGRGRAHWHHLLRHVHARRKVRECPTVLEDLSGDTGWAPFVERPMALTRAAAAYRRAWDTQLAPYDGMLATLAQLGEQGWRVVAYTESDASIAAARLVRMGFSGVISRVFGRASSAPAIHRDWSLVEIPARLPIAVDVVPRADLKPSANGLRDIAARCNTPLWRVAYLGDSLRDDVAMARGLGVRAMWAAYGATPLPQQRALLDAIVPWATAAAVDQAAVASAHPDAVVHRPRQLAEAVLAEAVAV
jgi:phosphoglycolate phosphatase